MNLSKEEKAMWLEDWKRSGKKAWTYARENGFVPQTFVNWTKPRSKNSQSIVEIPAKTLQSTRLVQEIRVEKGNVKIYIPSAICMEELRTILMALGAVQ